MQPLFLLALLLPQTSPAPETAPKPDVRELGGILAAMVRTLDTAPFYEKVNDAFKKAVPEARLKALLRPIHERLGEAFRVETDPPGWDFHGVPHLIRLHTERDGVLFQIGYDKDGRLETFLIREEAPVRSRKELEAELTSWKGDWGLFAERIEADRRRGPAFERDSGRRVFPIGSIFKVYVLAEVARRIAAGELDWEQPVTLREEAKSLPSGVMQDLPSGNTYPLRRFVRLMIGISDNTAADHLLELVGRRRVEAHLGEYFNSVPERNTPFLTTREMFLLRASPVSPGEQPMTLEERALWWAKAPPEERCGLLARLEESLIDEEPADPRAKAAFRYGLASLGSPHHAEIEWFAAPRDLVRLYEAAQAGRLVGEATSKTFLEGLAYGSPLYWGPGVRYQGFKGGSETGVAGLSLLLEGAEGRSVAVCLLRAGFPAVDPQVLPRSVRVATALARELLEREESPEGHVPQK
ncbi:MAG: serine hydrolase [Planctomycetota bacterium]